MTTPKYVGARVTRNEDPRLLRGQALFVDDVELPGLLHAAFLLHSAIEMPLPEAVAKVSFNPAQALRLNDRGEIAPGKRADLARVCIVGELPVPRHVWRAGERVV